VDFEIKDKEKNTGIREMHKLYAIITSNLEGSNFSGSLKFSGL
jgi:hypothetical protein